MSELKLVQISVDGSHTYIIHKVPVSRGIRGKSKGKVDELLIIGINTKYLHRFCCKNGIYITNKYVRDAETDEILLEREGDFFNYVLHLS